MTDPKIEKVLIGPVEAKELLDKNEGNRKEDWALIALYARQMAAGDWTFVGDPIRVSVTGRLLDGQNRLNAVSLSQTTQEFVLITGLPDSSQNYMDVGKKRTASDIFTMNGVERAPAASSIVSLVIRYDAGRTMEGSFKIASSELLTVYNGKEVDLFHRAATVGYELNRAIKLPHSIAGTVYVLARRVADIYTVEHFFTLLREGAGMDVGNPIHSFRNWLIRRTVGRDSTAPRVSKYEILWALMRTWNTWAKEETAFKTQLPVGGVRSSKQFFPLVGTNRVIDPTVSEDNPVSVPRGRTRKERDADAART